jgi:hypothetical protein
VRSPSFRRRSRRRRSRVRDRASRTPSSGVARNDDFGGRVLFPFDNWWNQDISRAPLDGQSNAFIDYIGGTRTLHPDFGALPYGIPYIGVGGSQTRMPITFVDYGSNGYTEFT